jgi:hypothetical protein
MTESRVISILSNTSNPYGLTYEKIHNSTKFGPITEKTQEYHIMMALDDYNSRMAKSKKYTHWVDVKIELPRKRGNWSAQDVLVLSKFSYHIGRLHDNVWVDMSNKPIDDVEYWMPLPEHPLQKETNEKYIQSMIENTAES